MCSDALTLDIAQLLFYLYKILFNLNITLINVCVELSDFIVSRVIPVENGNSLNPLIYKAFVKKTYQCYRRFWINSITVFYATLELLNHARNVMRERRV